LPIATLFGREVREAAGFPARFLGLAYLDLDQVGSGLLIPACSSVHTFGMRFALDIGFLDRDGGLLVVRSAIPAKRIVSCREAGAVLEIPSSQGGEFWRLCH
jgi:uncharacterized membrane protein (UPF0127 family)